MAGPPENISAGELWLSLTARPRPHRIVDFPRKDPITGEPIGQLAMRVLTQEEQMVCITAADKFAKEMLKESQKKGDENLGYKNLYDNQASVELLWRTCRDPKDMTRPAFPSPKLLREKTTTDEIGALMSAYFQMEAEIGPVIATMTTEEMDAWLDRIEKGGESMSPFYLLSSEMKNDLIRRGAHHYSICRTLTSSSGSLPEDAKNESATESNSP